MDGGFRFNLFPVGPVVGGNPVVDSVADRSGRPVRLDVGREDVFTRTNDLTVPRRGAWSRRGLVCPPGSKFSVVQRGTRPSGIAAINGHKTLAVELEAIAKTGQLSGG